MYIRQRTRLFLLLASLFLTTRITHAVTLTIPTTSRRYSVNKRRQQAPLSSNDSDAVSLRGGGGGSSSSPWMEGLKNSLASALAAACSKTILAPFDTIKTMQQHHGGGSLRFWEATKLITSRPKGFMELYAGLGVAVLGSMPSVGLYFGVYSYCKRKFSTLVGEESALVWTASIMTSAAIGNTVASFSRVPYEVVKQNLQTGLYETTWQALVEMSRSGGLRAFFPMGGVSIQMLRDIPYAMVTLLSYEYLRHQFVEPYLKKNPETTKTWCDMIAGAVAGGIGSFVTNPMDVLKTRIQTSAPLYNGSIRTCAQMTWEEGPMAFLRGSVPRLLHKVPANGFFFLFYEFFRRLLHVHDEKEVE